MRLLPLAPDMRHVCVAGCPGVCHVELTHTHREGRPAAYAGAHQCLQTLLLDSAPALALWHALPTEYDACASARRGSLYY
jgi:hypothetical protein